MRKRLNIILPEETVQLMDRVTVKGDRSRLIDRAVKHYIHSVGRKNLRRRLKEGAEERAERDLAVAEEWFAIDEDVWTGERG